MNSEFLIAAAAPAANTLWILSGVLLIVLLSAAIAVVVMARRYFDRGSSSAEGFGGETPRSDNPAAFMTASMQAVIKKLKEQEKELEALHRAERERAQQTERMSEAVTRNMPAGLLLVNSAGLITSANPAAEAALGVKSLAYRRSSEVLGTGSRLTELVAGCLEHGRTFRREEVEYLTPSHELRQLGVTISPIQNNANEITGAICLLSDLTELAALQKQIHMKENLAALGELSAGIAHEFKNALATISGYAQMIRSEAQPGTDLREHGELILQQTRSLTHVVTEFLKFARPLELADEQVSLSPIIERIVAEIGEAVPGVPFVIMGDFGQVSGDDALLRQALLNLARNAAEAASDNPAGGRVIIRGEIDKSSPLQGLRISITDNGPGIPPEAMTRIFMPFYTTKTNGTGLGLAVVQKIIVQHGGSIEARNQAQGGAEFIVWLPFVRENARAIDSAAARI
ncbi:MAG TPA: ATP-binding protein [Candidatus Acidoferrales bacterium]|nr:ATP-binding protein [Candidatus Acidoferrales bacterium]